MAKAKPGTAPEHGAPRSTAAADTGPPAPTPRSSDAFIVDNSDEGRKVAWYLGQWCDLARALDVATGYLEIGSLLSLDGQWQKLEHIRILMGDEVSKRTKQAFVEALQGIEATLDGSIEREKERNDFLAGVPAIVAALKSGQIACRVYRERKFHAKAYITQGKIEVLPPFALVGSSNFTYPGLHDNVELNVQLRHDVEELQAWYERHWVEAEDVTADILRTIERHVRDYSPFEVYAKALYEFFRGRELTADAWEKTQSRMYPVLDEYQREGYHALMKIAEQYRGAFLCDSVGLGKTFIGLMLIERLLFDRKRVALFVPYATREPVWEAKLDKHLPGLAGDYGGLAIYNHSDLLRGGDYPARMARIKEMADAVIIDEAHHFRNQATQQYRQLWSMLDSKQVFLLTATPINNTLLDLQHQIELFSRRIPDHFRALGVHSLPGYFRTLENALKKLVGEHGLEVEISTAEAERVLADDEFLRELVVQRSRAYARASQRQSGGPQVRFPERADPQVVQYSLAKTYGALLGDLEKAFRKGKPLLSLAIYYPLAYYRGPDTSIDPLVQGRQSQVVGLIRTQLLKRFESSAPAFRSTCEELLLKLLGFVHVHSETASGKKRLERWEAQHEELLARVKSHYLCRDEDWDEDTLPPEVLEAVERLPPDEYKIDEILDETFLDLDQLAVFLDDLRSFTPARDDKLRRLVGLLKTDVLLRQQKVLIFSEYVDTARYLEEQLKAAGVDGVDEVDSTLREDRGRIIAAFAPYYNESSSAQLAERGWPETRVLISTDVLSEGLNLQDATLLINYDLHWNPVRLMQRIGRVDRRLDPQVEQRMLADHPEWKTVRGSVHFWNFLPPRELDRLLSLYERVAHKTLRISKVFGIEGRMLLTPQDDYQALKDFNHKYEGTPSAYEVMRLAYNELLRTNPGLEDRLASFPLRVFSAKEKPEGTPGGARAIFFCYVLPGRDPASSEWTTEAGSAQWFLYDLERGKVLEREEQIEPVIRSTPDTPRRQELAQDALVAARKAVEKHITNAYLKPLQAPVGVKPVLKTWMELN